MYSLLILHVHSVIILWFPFMVGRDSIMSSSSYDSSSCSRSHAAPMRNCMISPLISSLCAFFYISLDSKAFYMDLEHSLTVTWVQCHPSVTHLSRFLHVLCINVVSFYSWSPCVLFCSTLTSEFCHKICLNSYKYKSMKLTFIIIYDIQYAVYFIPLI